MTQAPQFQMDVQVLYCNLYMFLLVTVCVRICPVCMVYIFVFYGTIPDDAIYFIWMNHTWIQVSSIMSSPISWGFPTICLGRQMAIPKGPLELPCHMPASTPSFTPQAMFEPKLGHEKEARKNTTCWLDFIVERLKNSFEKKHQMTTKY